MGIGGAIESITQTIASDFNTQLKLEELQQFYEEHIDDFGMDNRDINKAIQTTKANINWVDTNYETIVTWLQNRTRDNDETTTIPTNITTSQDNDETTTTIQTNKTTSQNNNGTTTPTPTNETTSPSKGSYIRHNAMNILLTFIATCSIKKVFFLQK